MRIARRGLLAGAAAFAAGSMTAATPVRSTPVAAALCETGRTVERHLVAAQRPHRIGGAEGPVVQAWTFGDEALPIVRLRRGDELHAHVENRLDQHISVHWHGIRVPNAMDGVSYLTQPPIRPGDSFDYAFTPPDTGTFFFHTHCNTIEQLGRGLAGVLIVEGDETVPFDAELVCVLRDWRVDEQGRFTPFTSATAAAKAGTFGRLRTVNDQVVPVMDVPAGGDVRVRLLNVDPTRIAELGVEGADAAAIAVDGNGLPPLPLETWRLGPAMRLDLAMRAPGLGEEAVLFDYFAAEPIPLARFRGVGPGIDRGRFDPQPLILSDFPAPDPWTAEKLRLTFQATAVASDLVLPDGQILRYADGMCLSGSTHWAINRQSWPEAGHERLPPALFDLQRGRSYEIELVNATQNQHPIHLHGVTFQVLDPRQGTAGQRADTVLLGPRDRVRIAFVADAPGDWMLHCHVIEHQETGMMGYFRVA
ncbi:MAG TPA: multicopper oxidase family protein [Geminicoccus sp.]|jgi:FtsP/CotA-like multicopper oxidase with cupredoxin domain|uniref:multicopper oxidase family protein n=1 Tax=Geminicoccus sp. TaxID=2024832 RepID=UPI002E34471D|nr:multicopper oxidase family protein [Geminicoccus sp.]HEX2528285.1 multicopper oxidase family protein [Geminicoccus sp.]